MDSDSKIDTSRLINSDSIKKNKGYSDKISFRYTKMRYVGLLCACLIMVGSYYCFDNPSSLQTHFQDENGPFKLSTTQFNLLYSVYSFPNIILPFMGGLLLDKIGSRRGVFIFTIVLILGQAFFMYGASQQSFALLLIGRVIFGFGGECLVVAQSMIVSEWFKDSNLAFALGINISVSRLGSTMNTILTPRIYEINNSFVEPLFVGLLFCVFSFLVGLILIWMDYESDRREGVNVKRQSNIEDQVVFKDIFNFGKLFWFLTLNCCLIYGAFFTFNNNSNDFLGKMFGIETTNAGSYISAVFIISATITPFFGIFVDKFGRICYMMLFSLITFLISQIIYLVLPQPLETEAIILIPLCLMGIFYATYAAIFWPCIPLIVDKNKIGTAYGVVNSVQNLNLAVSPLIFGFIKDQTQNKDDGYFWAEIFIIGQVAIGLITTIIVNILDKRGGSVLNRRPDNKTLEFKKSKLRYSFR